LGLSFEGWKEMKLADVIELSNGKKRPSQNGQFPVYGGNGIMDFTDRSNSKGESIIIGRVGAYCGNVYYEDNPCWISDNAISGKPVNGNSGKFLYYKLCDLSLHNFRIGSSQPLMTQSIIKDIVTKIPKPSEQLEIASILSALDEKIELNNAINKNLEEMAQALFKRWFVDFEFPNENGEPYKSSGGEFEESELGLIPISWSLKSIYDLAKYINGASFKTNEIGEVGVPIIKIAELKGGITSQTKHYRAIDKDNKYFIENEDILFSWSGNPDTSIDTFIWFRGKGILNQHIFKVVPYSEYHKGYVYALLKYMRSTFALIAGGKQTTGLGHVTVKDLQRLKIAFSDENTISVFSQIINPITKQIYNNNRETELLNYTRAALLPKLMSGEIRVPVEQEYANSTDLPMVAETSVNYNSIT
jgi:type I restriction enzyme S subunit